MKHLFLRMLLLFFVTMSLGLSFSTVSNAEVNQATSSQDFPDNEDDADEAELEIEVNETSPMIHEVPFRYFPFQGLSIISHQYPHLSDNYIVSIDIPPLS